MAFPGSGDDSVFAMSDEMETRVLLTMEGMEYLALVEPELRVVAMDRLGLSPKLGDLFELLWYEDFLDRVMASQLVLVLVGDGTVGVVCDGSGPKLCELSELVNDFTVKLASGSVVKVWDLHVGKEKWYGVDVGQGGVSQPCAEPDEELDFSRYDRSDTPGVVGRCFDLLVPGGLPEVSPFGSVRDVVVALGDQEPKGWVTVEPSSEAPCVHVSGTWSHGAVPAKDFFKWAGFWSDLPVGFKPDMGVFAEIARAERPEVTEFTVLDCDEAMLSTYSDPGGADSVLAELGRHSHGEARDRQLVLYYQGKFVTERGLVISTGSVGHYYSVVRTLVEVFFGREEADFVALYDVPGSAGPAVLREGFTDVGVGFEFLVEYGSVLYVPKGVTVVLARARVVAAGEGGSGLFVYLPNGASGKVVQFDGYGGLCVVKMFPWLTTLWEEGRTLVGRTSTNARFMRDMLSAGVVVLAGCSAGAVGARVADVPQVPSDAGGAVWLEECRGGAQDVTWVRGRDPFVVLFPGGQEVPFSDGLTLPGGCGPRDKFKVGRLVVPGDYGMGFSGSGPVTLSAIAGRWLPPLYVVVVADPYAVDRGGPSGSDFSDCFDG